MLQEIKFSPYELHERIPKANQLKIDTFYKPYLELEKDFRNKFLELKIKLEKELDETAKERRRVSGPVGKDLIYKNCNEIKSLIGRDQLKEFGNQKIIFNGDGAAGKTSLIFRLGSGIFPEYLGNYVPDKISYILNNGKVISTFNIWDTPGQDDYDRLRPLSYLDTKLFFLCFCIASINNFERIKTKWIPEIKFHNPDIPIILVGCKIDYRKNQKILKELKFLHFTKIITFEEGELMARNSGCCTYIETSAWSGEGAVSDFTEIASKSLIYYQNQRELSTQTKKCQLM